MTDKSRYSLFGYPTSCSTFWMVEHSTGSLFPGTNDPAGRLKVEQAKWHQTIRGMSKTGITIIVISLEMVLLEQGPGLQDSSPVNGSRNFASGIMCAKGGQVAQEACVA